MVKIIYHLSFTILKGEHGNPNPCSPTLENDVSDDVLLAYQ
jgi:hypothetical protein